MIDSGSHVKLVNKETVLELNNPVNRPTTPRTTIRSIGGGQIMTEETGLLVVKSEDSAVCTAVRLHVLPQGPRSIPYNVVLELDWVGTTRTYIGAM